YRVDGYAFPDGDDEHADEVLARIERFGRSDVLVVENDGREPYELRMLNEALEPDLVVVTAVGQGAIESLGRDRRATVRAFARSVPAGSRVVTAERNEALFSYLAAELNRSDVSWDRRIRTGTSSPIIDGLELVDEVLDRVDGTGLSGERRPALIDAAQPSWSSLESGRVFDATDIHDTEAIELLRRSFAGESSSSVVPIVCLSSDRYDRIADIVDYLDWLAAWGEIDVVHAVDGPSSTLKRRVSVPVRSYGSDQITPDRLVSTALQDGSRLLLLANHHTSFVEGLTRIPEKHPDSVGDSAPTPSSLPAVDKGPERDRSSSEEQNTRAVISHKVKSVLVLSEDSRSLWSAPLPMTGPALTISFTGTHEESVRTRPRRQGYTSHVGRSGRGTFVTIVNPDELDTVYDVIFAHLAEWDDHGIIRLDGVSSLFGKAGTP
ncbi:MAG: hypothetical protein R3324_14300, partial [Halobacteriales archaeon]|nr:hypothetical protein [Halobacteriales archaeon]